MTEQSPPSEPVFALSDLLTIAVDATENGIPYLHASLDLDRYDDVAQLLAETIAVRRIRNRRLLRVWRDHALGGDDNPIDARDERVLQESLLENVGTPDAPASDEHLHGFVAESLWLEIVEHVPMGPGTPVRVEGHDWSSTDPGGDGLTIYRQAEDLSFRLWESKYHGADTPVRDSVNLACRQINERALKYLARFSLVEQQITDDRVLALFYSRLPELWANRDPAAGVGIAVSAADADGSVFDRVSNYFELDAAQHQGHLSVTGDFPGFASKVKESLWSGCGSWNAH